MATVVTLPYKILGYYQIASDTTGAKDPAIWLVDGPGIYGGVIGQASVSTTVFKIQGTTGTRAEVAADTATWADVTGLTGITNTQVIADLNAQYTAIRVNVTTAHAGDTLTIFVYSRTANQ